jgi:prepilin-type N-terminal cleavage/methylation domain-containing protein
MAPETTSPTSARSTRPAGAASAARKAGGFTLVEMLVVIGIVVLLVGLAAPMITRAWKAGDRARTYSDLQAIAGALEAYRQDHGDYPRVSGPPYVGADPNWSGARMLCRALIAPGPAAAPTPQLIPDGNEGPGFRIRGTQGKVYGPYLKLETFKLGDPSNPTLPSPVTGQLALLDRYGKPILYFPASAAKPNIRVAGSPPPFVGQSELSMYDLNDNLRAFDTNAGNAIRKMRQMLGDINNNGYIDTTETEAYNGPFILWSSGPDETFGPAPGPTGTPAEIRKAVDKSDDITNFRK